MPGVSKQAFDSYVDGYVEAINKRINELGLSGQDALKPVQDEQVRLDRPAGTRDFVDLIRRMYPSVDLYSRGEWIYPCVVYPVPRWQSVNGEYASVLADEGIKELTDDLVISEPYYDFVQHAIKISDNPDEAYDGEHFGVERIVFDNDLKLYCRRTKYCRAMATCDALQLELEWAWDQAELREQLLSSDDPAVLLPYRGQLHEKLTPSQLLTTGAYRDSAIAISTLLVVPAQTDANYAALLLNRNRKKLSFNWDQLHVAPSAMFEMAQTNLHPTDITKNPYYDLKEQVLREYAEELYSYKPSKKDRDRPDWYKAEESVQQLEKWLKDGDASLHLTGLMINLVNLRPEITMLLLIHSKDWWNIHYRLNSEWLENDKDRKPRSYIVPVSMSDNEIYQTKQISPEGIVPPGAAAFWLGLDLVRQEIERYKTSDKRFRDLEATPVWVDTIHSGVIEKASDPKPYGRIMHELSRYSHALIVDEVNSKVIFASFDPMVRIDSDNYSSKALWSFLKHLFAGSKSISRVALVKDTVTERANFKTAESHLSRLRTFLTSGCLGEAIPGQTADKQGWKLEGGLVSCAWIRRSDDINASSLRTHRTRLKTVRPGD